MILFQLPKDLVAGMRKTSRYVTALKQIFSRVHLQSSPRVSHVIDISMVMLMSCLLVCRDLIGKEKEKAAWSRVCISLNCSRYLQGVALEKFPTLSDQKAVSKPPPTLLSSRLQSVIIFLLSHVALRNPERLNS